MVFIIDICLCTFQYSMNVLFIPECSVFLRKGIGQLKNSLSEGRNNYSDLFVVILVYFIECTGTMF